jgi:Right handed beta helix region
MRARREASLAVLAVFALLTAVWAEVAQAGTLTVDRFDDPDPALASACTAAANDCSLRGAVINANATPDVDTIQLQAGTYTLTRPTTGGTEADPSVGDLDLTHPVTLIGVSGTIIDALAVNDRGIEIVGSGAYGVTRLEVRGGRALEFLVNNRGGGINNANFDATLTLTGVTLRNNMGADGGGVHSSGPLIVNGCVVTENASSGIEAWRTLTITDSTITKNKASGVHPHGSGEVRRSTIANNEREGFQAKYAASWTIVDCTISGNTEEGVEWLDDEGDTLTIVNSTISDNGGAGLLAASAPAVRVTNSTIVRNQRGLVSTISESTPAVINYVNSLIAQNGVDCVSGVGLLVSEGFNLDSDGTCATEAADTTAADPRLGPLADNGGPTQTVALLADSPAINKGNDALAPEKDQRGFGRNGFSDIGAFEFGGIGPSPSPTPSPGASPTPAPSQLLNLSTRGRVQTGDNVPIGGVIITGNDPKRVLLRAIGPSANVNGNLADPVLELRHSSGGLPTTNDNWKDSPQRTDIEGSGLAPKDDRESAILQTLSPGGHTAIVRGKNGATGVALVEVYDLDSSANSLLANLSTRGFVETADNVMIGGFITGGGSAPTQVLLRGIGPSLKGQLPNALDDPTLELRDANGAVIAGNDNWKDAQRSEIEATGIPPSHDLEAAIVWTLSPAAYTTILRGKNETIGIGLVEIYNIR